MIENYYYSIPKWKKIIIAVCVGLLLCTLVSTHVNSGLLSWFTKKATDNITNEIFDALNETCGEVFGEILGAIGDILTAPWGPSLGTFIAQTNFAGTSADVILENLSIWVGVFISTLIWGFGMFTFFFSGKFTDSKDTPLSLTVRYGVALAISYKSRVIIETYLAIIDTIYSGYVMHAISMGTGNFAVVLAGLIEGWIKNALTSLIVSEIPGALFVLIILEIIITFKVIKGFFKLWAEMISRYIISVVLLLFFAAFGGTIVSNNSTQIFKSYLRTLFSSFIVMLLNMTWFKLCILVALGARTEMSPLQYFFLLELLHFGLKLDGIMRSMGLGVASGGARIASAVQGAGQNMMRALQTADRLRKAGGAMLQEGAKMIAAKGGDPKHAENMFKVGAALGATAKDIMSGAANPNNSAINMAASYGSDGHKIPDNMLKQGDAANIMANAFKNPNDMHAQNAFKALSNNALKQGAQDLLGPGYKVNSASATSVKGADGMRHNGVNVNASKVNPFDQSMAGQQAAQKKAFDGTISGAGTFSNAESVGGDMGFEMQKDSIENSVKSGESVAAKDLETFGGTAAQEALDSAQGLNFDQGEIESMGRNKDGDASFRCWDSDGNMCGTIQGDQFIANSGNDENAKAKAMEEMKHGIETGGYQCSDFEPVAGKDGVYTATGVDIDGNQKKFTATDRGVYTDSKLNSDMSSFRYNGLDGAGNTTSFDVNASDAKDTGNRGRSKPSNIKFNSDGPSGNGDGAGSGSPVITGGDNTISEPDSIEEAGGSSEGRDRTTMKAGDTGGAGSPVEAKENDDSGNNLKTEGFGLSDTPISFETDSDNQSKTQLPFNDVFDISSKENRFNEGYDAVDNNPGYNGDGIVGVGLESEQDYSTIPAAKGGVSDISANEPEATGYSSSDMPISYETGSDSQSETQLPYNGVSDDIGGMENGFNEGYDSIDNNPGYNGDGTVGSGFESEQDYSTISAANGGVSDISSDDFEATGFRKDDPDSESIEAGYSNVPEHKEYGVGTTSSNYDNPTVQVENGSFNVTSDDINVEGNPANINYGSQINKEDASGTTNDAQGTANENTYGPEASKDNNHMTWNSGRAQSWSNMNEDDDIDYYDRQPSRRYERKERGSVYSENYGSQKYEEYDYTKQSDDEMDIDKISGANKNTKEKQPDDRGGIGQNKRKRNKFRKIDN